MPREVRHGTNVPKTGALPSLSLSPLISMPSSMLLQFLSVYSRPHWPTCSGHIKNQFLRRRYSHQAGKAGIAITYPASLPHAMSGFQIAGIIFDTTFLKDWLGLISVVWLSQRLAFSSPCPAISSAHSLVLTDSSAFLELKKISPH